MENKPVLKTNKLFGFASKVMAVVLSVASVFSFVACGGGQTSGGNTGGNQPGGNEIPDRPVDPGKPPIVEVESVDSVRELLSSYKSQATEFLEDVVYVPAIEEITGRPFDANKILSSYFDISNLDDDKLSSVNLVFTYISDQDQRTTYVADISLAEVSLEEISKYAFVDADKYLDVVESANVIQSYEYEGAENNRQADFARRLYQRASTKSVESLAIAYTGVRSGKFTYSLLAETDQAITEYSFACGEAENSSGATYTVAEEYQKGQEQIVVQERVRDDAEGTYQQVEDIATLERYFAQEIESFINLQLDQVYSSAGIDESEVTDMRYQLISVMDKINGVEYTLTTDTEEAISVYTIEVEFETPVSMSAIANQNTHLQSGNVVSMAVADAQYSQTDVVVTDKQQGGGETEVNPEDILADATAQANINANLMPVLEEALKKSMKWLYDYDAKNILDYKWSLGEVDENGCVQNLQLLTTYKSKEEAEWIQLLNVKLVNPVSLADLATEGNEDIAVFDTSISTSAMTAFSYSYDITVQSSHSKLMAAIRAKLAEEDSEFDYSNAQMYQSGWMIAGNTANGKLVFVTETGQIRQLYVEIDVNIWAGTDSQIFASAINYLEKGDWTHWVTKSAQMGENQLVQEVENQRQ